jgi:hypothetical protein
MIEALASRFNWSRLVELGGWSTDVGLVGQAVRVISFHQLIGDGGKEGAREKFERLIAQLVRVQLRTVRRIDANPGDWGLDVIVGEIDGVISVWQAKFFIDAFGGSQQAQIRESFAQVLRQASQQGFTVDAWTLCIPVDLDAENLKWWTNWKKKQERETNVRVVLWDRTELEGLLLTPDAADIRAGFFPTTAATRPVAAPLAVAEVPGEVSYDDMLFVKQLEAAAIFEHESAKQQFFNAELLSREVADKRVPEHMLSLQAERADLRSMWEDRYNRACATCDGPRLPELHAEVMQAIERRHDGASVQILPMHLVHRKGSMHQVVEDGLAGWVRDFRALAEAHRG